MNTNITYTATEIRFYKPESFNMPVMILKNDSGREVGYLAPFRNYAFQVSATFDGCGDLGSSKVIGLQNVIRSNGGGHGPSNLNWEETTWELLKGQACIALMQFASRDHAYINLNSAGYFGNQQASNGEKVWCNNLMDLFILEVVHYLNPTTRLNKLNEYLESLKAE